MKLTLWLDVSWDIDNGWFAFLGSDPKADLGNADNGASDAGLDMKLSGANTLITINLFNFFIPVWIIFF